jgi:hypothetical protein
VRAHYRCEIKRAGACIDCASVADHVIPVDEGGPSTIENAQACRACNAAKGYLRRIERAGGGVPSSADLDGSWAAVRRPRAGRTTCPSSAVRASATGSPDTRAGIGSDELADE